MSKVVEEKLEHLKLKVFLYKYIPEFVRDKSNEKKEKTLGKLDRYRIELDEFSYFWKYDITDFVSSYNFSQSIDDNTYSWSMILQDGFLTLDDIDERLRVEGTKLSRDASAFHRIAQYEAQARDITDTDIIQEAKKRRGITQPSLTVRIGDNLPTKEGFLLSDLIQPYDFISCFIYKNNTPVSELKGEIKTSTAQSGLKCFKLSEKKTGLIGRFKNAFKSGKTLTSADLQKESILLSNVNGSPLFSSEFNGFVSQKSTTVNVNGVNVVNIRGNGITRLFGTTRRVMKPSLFQSSIYDIGELVDPGQAVPFQNVYVNRTVQEIFADLFGIVYRVKFPTQKEKTFSLSRFFSQASDSSVTEFLGTNFYDISSLIVGNNLQTNLFTIPPFLLSLVMKRRGFSYRDIKGRSGVEREYNQEELLNRIRQNGIAKDGTIKQFQVDQTIDSSGNLQTTISDQSPIFFSEELKPLRAFFKLITNVFNFFNAELRTPFEIIDEIKDKTFLEFFERPDGVIIVRPPQYNDNIDTIFSSDLEIQNYSYSETIDGLVARQKVGYGTDIIEQLEPIKEYSYGNGKLLIQYGFMEAGTDPNPNVKNDKVEDNEITESKEKGLAKYAEYFLRLHNAALKTATFTANLNPKITIGKTFFDESSQKFGYITSVSKNVSVGGTATASFNLSYVRDAYLADTKEVQTSTLGTVTAARRGAKDPGFLVFENLTRLVDIAAEFTKDSVDTTVTDSEPPLVSFTPKAD